MVDGVGKTRWRIAYRAYWGSRSPFVMRIPPSHGQWDIPHERDTSVAVGTSRLAGFLKKVEERLDDVDRHREDDRGILFRTDLCQRLQVAQLHGGRNARENLGRVDQCLRSLELGLRMDDLGAPVAFCLRLLGDGANHVFRELDGSDLDVADLDTPGFRLSVQYALDVGAELLSFGKHLVQLMLSQHSAQGGLSEHVCGGKVVLDLNDGSFGIDHVEVEHRVNLHRDVVVRDHVLGRYLDDLDAQVDPHHFLDEGDQQHKARSFDPLKAPQGKDHRSLIFAQDLHARRYHNEGHDQGGRDDGQRQEVHGIAPFGGRETGLLVLAANLVPGVCQLVRGLLVGGLGALPAVRAR